MVNQTIQFTEVAEFGDGAHLLDLVDQKLRASNLLYSGHPNGLIGSLDWYRFAEDRDGLHPYSPSSDGVRDIDFPATYANEKPMAKKHRGDKDPDTFHVIADHGDRYSGTTGGFTLNALARLSLGVSYVAAQSAGSQVRSVIVGEKGSQPVIFDEQPFVAYEHLDGFDKGLDSASTQNGGKSGESSLSNALQEVIDSDKLHDNSDVSLVVSDFTQGASYSKRNDIAEFDWESNLRALHDSLGDRLFVIRLQTPAQIYPPRATSILVNGERVDLSSGDYAQLYERYSLLGAQKAQRISEVLKHIRHTILNSTDTSPLVTLTDFVFGTPEKE